MCRAVRVGGVTNSGQPFPPRSVRCEWGEGDQASGAKLGEEGGECRFYFSRSSISLENSANIVIHSCTRIVAYRVLSPRLSRSVARLRVQHSSTSRSCVRVGGGRGCLFHVSSSIMGTLEVIFGGAEQLALVAKTCRCQFPVLSPPVSDRRMGGAPRVLPLDCQALCFPFGSLGRGSKVRPRLRYN